MAGLRPPEKDIGPARASGWWAVAVAAAFVALILAYALLDRLGLNGGQTAGAVTVLAIGAFAVTGLLSPARRPADYHLADREVPPVSGGTAAAASFAGILLVGISSGLLATTDAIVGAATGLLIGLALSAILIAPGLDRFDGPTLGSFMDARFGRSARLAVAAASILASFSLLVAVTSTVGPALAAALNIGPEQGIAAAAALMALAVLPGGMRSLIATQAIQFALVAAGCLVCVLYLAVQDTLRAAIPSDALAGILGGFGGDRRGGDVLGTGAALLLMGAGAAVLPQVTAHARCAAGPREGRVTFMWAIGLALALTVGGLLAANLAAESGDPIAGIIVGGSAAPAGPGIPVLPAALSGLLLAGMIGGLLAAGSAAMSAAAAALGHDLWDEASGRGGRFARRRIVVTRSCVLAVAVAAWLAADRQVDAGALLGWALAFAAAGLFAPLLLGLWWRGCSAAGAAAGSAAGSAVCAALFILDTASPRWIEDGAGSLSAAALGLGVAFVISAVVSLTGAGASGLSGSRAPARPGVGGPRGGARRRAGVRKGGP